MRVIAIIDAVGTALALQLMALLASVLVITAVPASVALQRQLLDAAHGEKTGIVPFAREFRRAWGQAWVAGVIVPLVVGAGIVAVLFWSSVDGPAGPIATGLIVFLAGFAVSVYLAALTSSELDRSANWRGWIRAGSRYLVAAPLRGLWATVMFIGWVSLALYFPTLMLIGSALVPALIVRWCLADRADGPRSVA